MTYEQYWYGDALLVRDYVWSDTYRRKRENHSLWLAGLYIRDAINSSIGNAFIKDGTPPMEYPMWPYPLDEEDEEKQAEAKEKKALEEAEKFIIGFAKEQNAKMKAQKALPPA